MWTDSWDKALEAVRCGKLKITCDTDDLTLIKTAVTLFGWDALFELKANQVEAERGCPTNIEPEPPEKPLGDPDPVPNPNPPKPSEPCVIL